MYLDRGEGDERGMVGVRHGRRKSFTKVAKAPNANR